MTPLQGIAADIMHAVHQYNEQKFASMNPNNREMHLKRLRRMEDQARLITAAIQAGCNTATAIQECTGINSRVVHEVVAAMDNVQIIKSVKQFRFKLKDAS